MHFRLLGFGRDKALHLEPHDRLIYVNVTQTSLKKQKKNYIIKHVNILAKFCIHKYLII